MDTGYQEKNPHHVSGCWSCKGLIDDSVQYRCVACNWVICDGCGACAPRCTFCHNHRGNVNAIPVSNKEEKKYG